MSQDQIALIVGNSILQVLELCYEQGVTTTWRDIYLFLRFPEETWKDDIDLDEKIIISSREDLDMMKDVFQSKFHTKH
jgi:hypothetical protein